jgi:hypothetical protein
MLAITNVMPTFSVSLFFSDMLAVTNWKGEDYMPNRQTRKTKKATLRQPF